ncbi:hypothetical protein X975_16880, partial [Stegodyphus mimosarum]
MSFTKIFPSCSIPLRFRCKPSLDKKFSNSQRSWLGSRH